jgi:hypothetical protein
MRSTTAMAVRDVGGAVIVIVSGSTLRNATTASSTAMTPTMGVRLGAEAARGTNDDTHAGTACSPPPPQSMPMAARHSTPLRERSSSSPAVLHRTPSGSHVAASINSTRIVKAASFMLGDVSRMKGCAAPVSRQTP